MGQEIKSRFIEEAWFPTYSVVGQWLKALLDSSPRMQVPDHHVQQDDTEQGEENDPTNNETSLYDTPGHPGEKRQHAAQPKAQQKERTFVDHQGTKHSPSKPQTISLGESDTTAIVRLCCAGHADRRLAGWFV
ncbi:hypothetical protein AAL_05495 [Moelleriella libera RCEF 2490]|uniref:Uncharacterized protein n=1 Tax=Moelleriella libera RCEF 2490 TaxID=1081109 RepID=A0A168AD59_9HYPO|nr:hypothetical protein AAL_05495 [Moelleriella libera RCEF 2490]